MSPPPCQKEKKGKKKTCDNVSVADEDDRIQNAEMGRTDKARTRDESVCSAPML